jgi:histidinol-phosphate aminotransferase
MSALPLVPEPLDVCERAPAHVRAISPYQPGKPITELARDLGMDEKAIVKLASNENPMGLSPKARTAIEAAIPDLGRYPDQFSLVRAIAERTGVPPAGVVLGNGSNDLLEMVAAVFLSAGRSSVYAQHAFAVYPLATLARGATGIVVPAKDYGHDLDAMRAAIRGDTTVVFVANPNNPTGTFLDADALARFLAAVPAHVAVVLDEAYNEYLPPSRRIESTAWLARHPNLVVTRTFSKAYGLAGLRVGYALCHASVADLLHRVRQPFNVNNIALAAAEAALGDDAFVAASREVNDRGMAQVTEGLRALGLEWIPSCGNFVAVRIPRQDGAAPRAGAVYQAMLRQGVIVRPVAGYEMPDYLRVTIGLPGENARFLAALRAAL